MPMPRPPSRSGSMPAARQYFLTSRQGVLRSRCRRSSPLPSGFMGRNKGPSLSFADARPLEVRQDRPGRVEQDLPPLLVPLLGHVEVVLDPIGLQVPHAGRDHRRDPAAGDEEDTHQGQVADPLQGLGRNRLQEIRIHGQRPWY